MAEWLRQWVANPYNIKVARVRVSHLPPNKLKEIKLKIKRDGLLYRLGWYGGLFTHYSNTDVCSMFWRFVGGIFIVIPLVTIFSALGAFFVLNMPFTLMMWAITGVLLVNEPFLIAVTTIAILIAVIAVIAGSVKVSEGFNESKNEAAIFTKKAYKGFKEKVCFMVEVE